jgi:hypothetical protein
MSNCLEPGYRGSRLHLIVCTSRIQSNDKKVLRKVSEATCLMKARFALAWMRNEETPEKIRSFKNLRSSVSLSLRPFFARFCALPLLFYRRLFIRTSHLEFFKKTLDLDFAFQSFNGFFYVISNNSYLYDGLSPVSFLT